MSIIKSNENVCFSKDTRIAIAGRESVTLEELAKDGIDIPVYTINQHGRLTIRMGRSPRKTRFIEELIRVHFDNGSYQDVTDYHKFPLKTGEIILAQELETGDRVHMLHRSNQDGRVLYRVGSDANWWADNTLISNFRKQTPILPSGKLSEDLVLRHNDISELLGHLDQASAITDLEVYINRDIEGYYFAVDKDCEQCGDRFTTELDKRHHAYCCEYCAQQASKLRKVTHIRDRFRTNMLMEDCSSEVFNEQAVLLLASNHKVTHIERILYRDFVYCVTVDEFHTLFTMTQFGKMQKPTDQDFILSYQCGQSPF